MRTSVAQATTLSPPPNVLLVTIDALRADQLGAYGHPFVQTPALNAFAAQGARFTSHMVQEPQTDPSHAALFTGMYPSSNGVRIHMVDKLASSFDTLATVFHSAGYATAGLFSWMSLQDQYCGLGHGFDVYQDLTASLATPTPLAAGQSSQPPKGRADLTTNAGIAQLKTFGGKPFFMWLHYFDCHAPYELPTPSLDRYDPGYTGNFQVNAATIDALRSGQLRPSSSDLVRLISLYQAEITFLDSQISRLFSTLDDLNLTPNTIVAVTADHGESFSEHADFVEASDFFHPCGLYNPEGRAPLLLRYPATVSAGQVISAPTQAIDLFPTLTQLAGLPASPQAQGASMVGLLNGTDDGSGRTAFAAMPDYAFTALSTPGWKLIQNNANGERRLYNRVTDPGEQNDQLTAQSDVATQLTAQLASWMRAVKISS